MLPARTTAVDRTGVVGLRVADADSWGAGKERCVRVLAGLGAGVRYGVHANNLKNMVRGITERVLYVVRDGRLSQPPQPKEGVFGRLAKLRGRLIKRMPPTPVVDIQDYPGLYTGRKRAVYQRAVDSLMVRDVSRVDSYVSTFLKAEKINFDVKIDPAPRVIQPRSPRYNVMVGRYLKLFEKRVISGFEREFGYAVICKGKNASEVGEVLAKNWASLEEPVAVGLDASRFDQHVSADALRFEHSFYNAVFQSDELRRLLGWQIDNRGIARVEGKRLDYTVHGCRMSGDINTSLGNCILMSCMVIGYCEKVGITYRLSNNGDDCVLMVNRGQMHKLAGLSNWMLEFGFTLTQEEPVYELEKVVFCQAQPVHTSTGWRMVRDPRSAMSKDCVSLLGWDNDQALGSWATAISGCGLSLTSGVPVWEAWYRQLQRLGSQTTEGVVERQWECGMGYMARGVVAGEVDDAARVSFWRAFGITPDQQVALEEEYNAPLTLGPVTPMTFEDVISLDTNNNPLAAWLRANPIP